MEKSQRWVSLRKVVGYLCFEGNSESVKLGSSVYLNSKHHVLNTKSLWLNPYEQREPRAVLLLEPLRIAWLRERIADQEQGVLYF